ncbi:asparagine synthetase B family protein [Fibrobacterota bacterium]
MCGIAGFIGQERIEAGRIHACRKLMQRRGPDFSDFFHHHPDDATHVYLIHSRLSIIDLEERANQPFHQGDLALVFNGEIYNYRELRASLQARGHRFTTMSDTEVLITMLATRGWQGLDACEGMWAFACYNKRTQELIVSRDRFGEKPLYLYRDKAGLYFGSEIKFIKALVDKKLEPDFDQMYRFLVNGYKTIYKSGRNFYQGIAEVKSGHVLQLTANG